MLKWAFLSGAIISEVTSSMSLKAATDNAYFYPIVLVGFLCAFTLLTLTLKQGMALGVAYGIWGAVGVAATAVLSAVVFDEQLTGTMIVGLIVIIIGVLIIELGSQRAQRVRA